MAVKIHHLNCGVFYDHLSKIIHRDYLCCHCILLEGDRGLALVDTGLPTHRLQAFGKKLHEKLLHVKEPDNYSALAQVQALGFSPSDVRDIFVTHLDHDHVGGVADFPQARVHLHLREYEFSKQIEASFKLKLRFKTHLWKKSLLQFYSEPGEDWNGFGSVKNTISFQDELMIIPLFGHTPGHTGYAVKDRDRWVFHAGDAFYLREDLTESSPGWIRPGELIARVAAINNMERVANLKKLRKLHAENPNVKIINSHDNSYLP